MAAKICWEPPKWEEITPTTCRMQVPGGWLVIDTDFGPASTMVYVPDPAFTWEWEKKEREEK